MKDIFTTLLIIFMVLKLIDFHALGILDIMLIILNFIRGNKEQKTLLTKYFKASYHAKTNTFVIKPKQKLNSHVTNPNQNIRFVYQLRKVFILDQKQSV